jgi:hypothetical protein
MTDLTLVAGDTAPPLNGTILNADGTPFDLSGCDVRFQMRLAASRRFAIDSSATIVSPAAGTVRYEWATTDLADAGDYCCQWQIELAGSGGSMTTDPVNTITIRSE